MRAAETNNAGQRGMRARLVCPRGIRETPVFEVRIHAKAAKATLSGAVPVVGGIISDASESVLAAAGVLKSSAGVFGMLAVIAIALAPFVRIAVEYLAMRLTAAVGGAFGSPAHTQLLSAVSTAMGYLLAMTGSCALMALISSCCFMKAVSG